MMQLAVHEKSSCKDAKFFDTMKKSSATRHTQIQKIMKKSFQNAVNSIEADPNYGQGGVSYTGMKVLLTHTNTNGETQTEETIDYHVFK